MKNQKLKTYLLIGAAIVFVAVGYFRFFYKKAPGKPGPKVSLASLVQLQVPDVTIQTRKTATIVKIPANEPIVAGIRDIFKSFEEAPVEKEIPKEQVTEKPAPVLKLRGVIVGGRNPLAIINDRFVGKGDMIDGFRVVSIDKHNVRLNSGHQQLVLKMVEDE